jgi:tyrosyl-tRNA synthetase
VEQQLRILTAGAMDCITEAELRSKLESGRPLRVKLGIDPTASDIHLGFAVVLRRMRQFQDLGHVAVLILGDFTARVGDPSGRSATRPPLTPEQVDAHATTYVDQVQGILDFTPGRIEILRNSSWLAPMDMADVLRLTARTTVARIMERDDFAGRFADGAPIALSELLYPLLQATDSVEVRADVELGGTDQLFNILMGRHLQSQAGQDPQVVLTTPLLEGLDGVQKMSKSLGNYIGIAEPPGEQFGKLMSIPDALMPRYFQLTTGWLPDQVERTLEDLRSGALTPVAATRLLARTVVDLYHGAGVGEQAEAEFDRVFKDHAVPTELEEREVAGSDLPTEWFRLLVLLDLATSGKDARRKLAAGAVRLDQEKVGDPDQEVSAADIDGRTISVGKRSWAKVRVRA